MTLAEYLAQPGRTATELAQATGSAVSTITRAARGEIIPSRDLMIKLFEATDGAVTPNDIFGIVSKAPKVEMCSLCERRTDDPCVNSCTAADCPNAVKVAA
ncbi:helix-turn-helix domain-containing protein [Sphingomonas sanxanigenens]|nr:helix-turn-helix transcriptional regulator [Sphingomonas sanxanigenens]